MIRSADQGIGLEIAGFMQQLHAMNLPSLPPEAQLQVISASMQRLASSPLWQACSWRSAAPGEELLHVVARAGEAAALYLVSDGVGTRSPPHEHCTWAVIAGIRGREANIQYQVSSRAARTATRTGRVEVGPGDALVMRTSEVHATDVISDCPTFHLHLYGRPLDTLPSFASRCYATGTGVEL